MDFANWQLKDTIVSARGVKSCHLRTADNAKKSLTIVTVEDALSTSFGATNFQAEETNRKTLEFTLTAEMEKQWKSIDEWAVGYLAKHSYRLFKAIKTEDQILENNRSPVTKKSD